MSTDLYGMAVLNACEQIMERLKPIMARCPGDSWEQIVNTAYFTRVDLTAHGFYTVPDSRCGYDWTLADQSKRGVPFNYYTTGVACSEVEVDCLTGDSSVVRTDILMDVGQSINPAIDIGQIEGAFVQGYGWCTMEELAWGDPQHPWIRTGQLFTRGPGTYKIPAFNDVPSDFRVHLQDTKNSHAVHSSKAVGEPPFFLGCTAFFALKNAIKAARAQQLDAETSSKYFPLQLPATSERIRMACADHFSARTIAPGSSETFQCKGSF